MQSDDTQTEHTHNNHAPIDDLERIKDALNACLDEQPIQSEHALIRSLKDQGIAPFPELDLGHSKTLFCAHFLVKHVLYRLQDDYLSAQRYVLDITSIQICRHPYSRGKAATVKHDSVKAYYLDLKHYFETSEEEVNTMLNDFWKRFVSQDERIEAFATLGLPVDSDYSAIKREYRTLAQQFHPDKGGCAVKFDRITKAKAILDKLYGK